MNIVLGVFGASLLGSVHCAAMCGAFVCAYAGQRADVATHGTVHASYHAGRLVSYTLLGAIAGAFGSGVERVGALAGVARGAAIVAGVLMMLWAASTIAAAYGVKTFGAAPEWPKRALGTALLRTSNMSATARAGAIGLLTTLLPCGWLYVFVATAAGTGSSMRGALTMLAFWAGSVPLLLTVGLGARRTFGTFARRLPVVSAACVLLLGLLSIAGKLGPSTSTATTVTAQHVHAR